MELRPERPGSLMKCECAHCRCDNDLKFRHPPIRFIGEEIQGDTNGNVRVTTPERMVNVCVMCWAEHYKRQAPVSDKLRIQWERRNMCPSCGVENLYPSGKASASDSSSIREFDICVNCGMAHHHIALYEGTSFSDSVRVQQQ